MSDLFTAVCSITSTTPHYDKINMIKRTITKRLLLTLTITISTGTSVLAGPTSSANYEYFGRNTGSPVVLQGQATKEAKLAPHTKRLPASTLPAPVTTPANAQKWFEAIETAIFSHSPSKSECVILTRSFNQEEERVKEWSNTAADIAHKYHDLSRQLRGVVVPSDMAQSKKEIQQFKKLIADWYDDAAKILEDYIRPRPAARTVEELDDLLNGLEERTHTLERTKGALLTMEYDLRAKFGVPIARANDPIRLYVERK